MTRRSVKSKYMTAATMTQQGQPLPEIPPLSINLMIAFICGIVLIIAVVAVDAFGPGWKMPSLPERTVASQPTMPANDMPAIVPTATSQEPWGDEGCVILPAGVYPQVTGVSYYQVGSVATLRCPSHVAVTTAMAFDIVEHLTGNRPEKLQ